MHRRFFNASMTTFNSKVHLIMTTHAFLYNKGPCKRIWTWNIKAHVLLDKITMKGRWWVGIIQTCRLGSNQCLNSCCQSLCSAPTAFPSVPDLESHGPESLFEMQNCWCHSAYSTCVLLPVRTKDSQLESNPPIDLGSVELVSYMLSLASTGQS